MPGLPGVSGMSLPVRVTTLQPIMHLACRNSALDLTQPAVMGVLNVTPDSFSDGGRYYDADAAIAHGAAHGGGGRAQSSTSAANPPGPGARRSVRRRRSRASCR